MQPVRPGNGNTTRQRRGLSGHEQYFLITARNTYRACFAVTLARIIFVRPTNICTGTRFRVGWRAWAIARVLSAIASLILTVCLTEVNTPMYRRTRHNQAVLWTDSLIIDAVSIQNFSSQDKKPVQRTSCHCVTMLFHCLARVPSCRALPRLNFSIFMWV